MAKVVKELHDGPVGGHYSGDTTAQKILMVGYYWPTLFKDAHPPYNTNKSLQLLITSLDGWNPFHYGE